MELVFRLQFRPVFLSSRSSSLSRPVQQVRHLHLPRHVFATPLFGVKSWLFGRFSSQKKTAAILWTPPKKSAVPSSCWRCDGRIDCQDGEDERDCKVDSNDVKLISDQSGYKLIMYQSDPFQCPDFQHDCGDGNCIEEWRRSNIKVVNIKVVLVYLCF